MKMIAAFLSVLASVFVIQTTHAAQDINYESENKKLCLWEITKDGKSNYLLGSIHVMQQSMYPLDKKIYDAYEGADTLVVEVNTSDTSPQTIQIATVKRGMYPQGQGLNTQLSENTLKKLETYLAARNLNTAMFNQMRPWLLATTLSIQEFMRYGFNPNLGIDQHFVTRADGKKEILGLETFDEQLDVLAGQNDEQQELFLLSLLEGEAEMESAINLIKQAWLEGDVDQFMREMNKEIDQYPQLKAFYDEIFIMRNQRMTERMHKLFNNGKTHFVVVGAGHMGGEKSIIDLLQDKGYEVTQIGRSTTQSDDKKAVGF